MLNILNVFISYRADFIRGYFISWCGYTDIGILDVNTKREFPD